MEDVFFSEMVLPSTVHPHSVAEAEVEARQKLEASVVEALEEFPDKYDPAFSLPPESSELSCLLYKAVLFNSDSNLTLLLVSLTF